MFLNLFVPIWIEQRKSIFFLDNLLLLTVQLSNLGGF